MTKTVLYRVASGDKAAVEECINLYGGLVWSLARQMSPNLHDAEDAVQEIFLDLWRNAALFDESKAGEITFVAMIARRRLIDRYRKIQREVSTQSLEEVTAEPESSIAAQMQNSVEVAQAMRAMNDLRSEQKQILQLAIFQGFSHQQIADALKLPLGTVKTHARRGLEKIRETLGLRKFSRTREAVEK